MSGISWSFFITNQRMKTFYSFILVILAWPSFPQEAQRIEIDKSFSLVVNGSVLRDSTEKSIYVSARMVEGDLTIVGKPFSNELAERDSQYGLQFVAKGYIASLNGPIEIIESVGLKVDGVPCWNMHFREGLKVKQTQFLVRKGKLYTIHYVQAEAVQDTERKKLFDSFRTVD